MRAFPYVFDLSRPLVIDGNSLTIEDVVSVARYRRRVEIDTKALDQVKRCRSMVDVLLELKEKVYGLTTGFGKLRDVVIEQEKTAHLQKNLIRSHSCGVGDPFPEDTVRAAMLLRANTLCKGNSGITANTLEQLIKMLNDDVYPYVPQKGSVGASGDLAPLSHLMLPLIGDMAGKYYPVGLRQPGRPVVTHCTENDFVSMPNPRQFDDAAKEEGWTFQTVELQAKEGLALNNGTQFMTAVASLALYDAYFTLCYSELAAAMSLEANRGVRFAYDDKVHLARNQQFQLDSARRVIAYCEGTQILDLYLNSARLNRAQISLKEAAEHLQELDRELTRRGIERPASVNYSLLEINALSQRVGSLIPTNYRGKAEMETIEHWAGLPIRKQIEVFNRRLSGVRQDALSLLQTTEQVTFPKGASTDKAVSALVATVDQLNRAVPDAPIVQDDYSFRCYPQVLGGAYRALWQVCAIVEEEFNSVTDNPLLFPPEPEEGFESMSPDQYTAWLKESPERIEECRSRVIGGGNFHGQPIATAMDYLSIAMAEIGSISERRIAHLVDVNISRGLPPFLIDSSGLNSGFMVPQYTAASLVSENKVLCHPASVDSIPTCANSEDHVSMGTIAARKSADILENIRTIIAIEILAAFQGLKFREPLLPGKPIQRAIEALQIGGVERFDDDRVIYNDIHDVVKLMNEVKLLDCLIGPKK